MASWPWNAAKCNAVQPRARKGRRARKRLFAWLRGKVLEVGEGKVRAALQIWVTRWNPKGSLHAGRPILFSKQCHFPQKSSCYCSSIFRRIYDGHIHVKTTNVSSLILKQIRCVHSFVIVCYSVIYFFTFRFPPHPTTISAMNLNKCFNPRKWWCSEAIFRQICVKSGLTRPAPRPRPALSTALMSAPAARSRSTVASWPFPAAECNGVPPRALKGRCARKTFFALLRGKVLEVGEGKVFRAALQIWVTCWNPKGSLHAGRPILFSKQCHFPQKSSCYCSSIFRRIYDGHIHVKTTNVSSLILKQIRCVHSFVIVCYSVIYFFTFRFPPHPTTISAMNLNKCFNPRKWRCSEAKFGQICVKSGLTRPAPRPRRSLSTALTLAPAARSRSTVASWPWNAAKCNAVQPRARKGRRARKRLFAWLRGKVLEVGEGKVRTALQIWVTCWNQWIC